MPSALFHTTHSLASGVTRLRSQLHDDIGVGRQPSLNADQQSGIGPLQKRMQRIRIFDGDTITDNDDDSYENSSEQNTSSKEKKSPKSEGYSTVHATLEKKIQRIRIFDGDTITDGEDKDENHDDVSQNSDMLTKQPPERRNAIHTEDSLKSSHSLQGKIQRIRIFDGDTISNDDGYPNQDSAKTLQLAEDNSTLAPISPVLDGSRGRKLNTRIAVRTDLDSPIANRGPGPFDSQQPPPFIPSPLVPSPLDNSASPLTKPSAIQNPYYGQWNLQESHLVEPLIAPGRNRSVSPDSRKGTLDLVSLERKATQTSIAQTLRSDLSSSDTDEYHEYDKDLEVGLSAKKCQVSGNPQAPAAFPPPNANIENPKTRPPMLEYQSRPRAPPPLNTEINDWDMNEASPAGPGRPSPADSKGRRTSLFRGLGLKLPSKDKDRDNGLNALHKSSFEELGQARRKSSSFFKMRNSSPGGLTPSPSTHSFSRSALSATSSTGHPPWAYTKASSDRPMSAHSPLSTSLSGPRSANSPLGNDVMSSGSIPSSATRSRFSGITGIFRQSLSGPSTGPKTAASHGNLRDVSQSLTNATTITRNKNNAALAFTPGHIHHRSNTRPLARPASQVLSPTGWETEEWNGPKSAGLVSQFGHSKPNLQPESLPSSRIGDSELLLSASVPQRRRQNSPYRKAHGDWSEFMTHSSNASVCNQISSSPTPSSTARNQTTLPGSPGLSGFPTRRGGIERDGFLLRAHKSTNSLISASSAEYRSPKMAMRDLASQHDRAISSGSSRLGEIHQFPDSSSLRSIPSYAVPAQSSPLAEPSTVPALAASRDIETPSSVTLPHSSAWSGHSIPRSHPYPHPAGDSASTPTSGNQAADFPSSGALSSQSNLHFSQTTQQDQHQQGTLSKWLGTKPTQTQFSKGQPGQQTRLPQQSKGLAKSFLGVFKKITSKASDPTLGQDSSTPQLANIFVNAY
ncbi:Flocculation protein FLO11 [Ceratocystis lukuohia]|uniref:Flocculation protein FLO11 n=1 Tax=Ceratocystis lukuohia TaxID=2019550 RepID=A0ABR4M8U5_9PEZI